MCTTTVHLSESEWMGLFFGEKFIDKMKENGNSFKDVVSSSGD